MANILSISYDMSLLLTRQMLLEEMGHTVYSAEGFAKAYELCEDTNGHFDLIILGHSIPREDKIAIVKQCKDLCRRPVLVLLRAYERPIPGADQSVESANPKAFITAVREMVG